MKIAKVRNVKTPDRGTSKSAGIDFYIPEDFDIKMLFPHTDVLIPSGIVAKIPEGYMLMGADKSGVVVSEEGYVRTKLEPRKRKPFPSPLIIGAKIIDEDYQGEIHIHVINVGNNCITLTPGMKIAQFILVPVFYDNIEVVDSREELFPEVSDRGAGGFGSTTK